MRLWHIDQGMEKVKFASRSNLDLSLNKKGSRTLRTASLLMWIYSETLLMQSLAHLAAPWISSSVGCLPPNRPPLPEHT